jgi:Amt family ammonium transporter
VARAVVSTLVGAACGGLSCLFVTKMMPGGKWSLLKLINGMLSGMVSVCAGCNNYLPWAAAIVSAVAGVLYVFFSKLVISFKVPLY